MAETWVNREEGHFRTNEAVSRSEDGLTGPEEADHGRATESDPLLGASVHYGSREGSATDDSDGNIPSRNHDRPRAPHRIRHVLQRPCTVILFATLTALAALLVLQYRKESALQEPWIPDSATREFERAPLAPPLERTQISNRTLPLRTAGRRIVDATGQRFRLASVNWYGGSDELFVPGGLDVLHRDEIAQTIKRLGFNSVRLPYADEMVMKDPIIDAGPLMANADLAGRTALDVFEAVVTALTDAGLAVVINDHITSATWCCGVNPCDASWTNTYLGPVCRVKMSEEQWIRNWETVMSRYVDNPLVIGADLRNEVRGLWGTMPWSSWAAAAEKCGNRLLKLNPHLLIIVEGTSSANDLSGVRDRSVRLEVANKLVYSSHVYGWSGWGSWSGRFSQQSYASFSRAMLAKWGYLLEDEVAPVWVGELGAPWEPNRGDATYWHNIWRYLTEMDADFGYWAINTRKPHGNEIESYSIIEEDWKTPILDYRLKEMTTLIRKETSS